MKTIRRQALLLFDGECAFCRLWIDYWRTLTGEVLSYAPCQEHVEAAQGITPEDCNRAVQLVTADGRRYQAALAVYHALAAAGRWRWLWMYRHVPGFAAVSEAMYRIIARHRGVFYRITLLLFGQRVTTGGIRRVLLLTMLLLGAVVTASFIF